MLLFFSHVAVSHGRPVQRCTTHAGGNRGTHSVSQARARVRARAPARGCPRLPETAVRSQSGGAAPSEQNENAPLGEKVHRAALHHIQLPLSSRPHRPLPPRLAGVSLLNPGCKWVALCSAALKKKGPPLRRPFARFRFRFGRCGRWAIVHAPWGRQAVCGYGLSLWTLGVDMHVCMLPPPPTARCGSGTAGRACSGGSVALLFFPQW